MGTISDKLTYLNTTKTMLRDSLNKFGSNILTTDTFRSYDTKLNDIYDKLPKVTQSGAGFTIENVQNGQVDDFKMIGVDLEQDTTTGKNLLNPQISSYESNGVSISYNNETQTITLNGTCTQNNTVFSFSETTGINNFTVNSGDTVYALIKYISGIETGNFFLGIYDNTWAKNVIAKTTTELTEDLIVSKTFYETVTFNKFRLRCENGTTFDNLKIKVYLSTIDEVYEPYTGKIAAPNPDYPQDIKVVEGRQVITDKRKNLLNIPDGTYSSNGVTAVVNKGVVTLNGTANSNSLIIFPFIFNFEDTKTYILSANNEEVVGGSNYDVLYSAIRFELSDGTSSVSTWCYFGTQNNSRTININYNATRFCIRTGAGLTYNNFVIKPQLEENSTATDYEPYYEPVSYNIDLQLENIYLAKTRNTDYKNRIYKNNGNWYFEKKIKKVVFDGSENWVTASASGGYRFVNNVSNPDGLIPLASEVGLIKCNKFVSVSASATLAGQNGIAIATSGKIVIYYDLYKNSSATAFKTWMSENNLETYYALANPVTIQITNTTLINQLEAISVHTGTNIITISNDNNIIPEIEITRLKELEKLS